MIIENYYPLVVVLHPAPEVIEGKKYDGIMVDIWSTGIILYSMLCGCFPFNDDNKDILYEKIIKGHINYPDNLDEDAIDLIKKILVNEPKRRISLQNIKKHIFYQKGRKEFIKMYNNIIKTNKENIKSKTIEDTRRNHNNYRIKISNFTNTQRIINNLQMSTDFNNMSKNKKQIYSKNDSGNKIKLRKIIKQEIYKENKIINDFDKKIEKVLSNQKYNNNNLEYSDDITYQGIRIKNSHFDNKNITINFNYNLINKINDNNKKNKFYNNMKINSYLGKKNSSSNNYNEIKTDNYILTEILDEKNNTINSIQNKNKIKIKGIINQNFGKDLKIKDNNISIKGHLLTENNDSIKSFTNKNNINVNTPKILFIDKNLKSFQDFNVLKNENQQLLKNDADNKKHIYTNNIEIPFNTGIKYIKNKMNQDSNKKYHQNFVSNKKEINNQISTLKYPKEINNMTSLNNNNIYIMNKKFKVKQVINPNGNINKNINYDIDNEMKSTIINNNKNFFGNKTINNIFIDNKNSNSFANKENYKNKIYTKSFDNKKKRDFITDFNMNNKIYSSNIKNDELKKFNYSNTDENINKNIKEAESSFSKTISIDNKFKKKLKRNTDITTHHSKKGIYVSKIKKSKEEQNFINNKRINDIMKSNTIIPKYNLTGYYNSYASSYDNKNNISNDFGSNKNNTEILNIENIINIIDNKKIIKNQVW